MSYRTLTAIRSRLHLRDISLISHVDRDHRRSAHFIFKLAFMVFEPSQDIFDRRVRVGCSLLALRLDTREPLVPANWRQSKRREGDHSHVGFHLRLPPDIL